MNSEKFTPVPWVIEPNSISNPQTRRCVVPFMKPINEQSEEGNANASLIACAPELYALVAEMNEAFYVSGKKNALLAVMSKSKALLQKARGES